jgi:outer membrane protein OmpA-like peptidoglycan-associated protein
METRESPRGLTILCMSDVLFDFNQATLKPEAADKLARVAKIVASHPELRVEIEGYTDSAGDDQYNLELSRKRALAVRDFLGQQVRDFLGQQGIDTERAAARGLGEAQPVASNDTPAGRQQNRRVEPILSGDELGTGEASRAR